MTALVIPLVNYSKFMLPEYRSKLWWICLVVSILLFVSFSAVVVYASGFGGLISEQLIDRSGVADSNLLIGRSGVSSSGLDVGMSGIAVLAGATNIYMDGAGTHATLHANLQTLNGLPRVIAYFEWGYDLSYGHTSASQTLTGIGAFSVDIAHFDPSQTVYYRAVVEGDGKSYSSSSSFVADGAVVGGFNLLNAVVVVAYIGMIIFGMIVLGRRSTIAALLFMAVAIFLGEAFVVAIQEALNALF